MAGSSLLFRGSSISLNPSFQFLTGPERHDAPGTDWNLFASLRIASGPLVLVAQIEVAEAGQFHLAAVGQRTAHFLKEQIDELARLALVEPELIEQRFGDLRF